MDVFDLPGTDHLLRTALAEDLGDGDVTTRSTVPADRRAKAEVRAKAEAVLAGLPLLPRIAALAGGGVDIDFERTDGDRVGPGDVLARLRGPATTLLGIERLLLNLLQQLSGVATLTAAYVEAIAGTGARIVDTRKTVPGLRALQKYAVRVGGGYNHRHNLADGLLIKNNHITAAGGVRAAVRAARSRAPHVLRVEIECTTRTEVDEALAAGAEVLLLDNMSVEELRDTVRHVAGRALLEASGGVQLDTVRAIAATGVDLISVGALTHSAPAVDLHLRLALD